jgi:uncharacterized protein (UPF0335 family)
MIESRQSSKPTPQADDVTTTSQNVAAGQLRAFIDRILRLKEEQDTIGDDVKEIYAEMKGVGFDRTAAGALVTEIRKKRKNGEAEFEERNTILDLYRAAYEASAQNSHTHASARTRENIEEFPPHDPKTGELLEDQASEKSSQASGRAGAPTIAPATNSKIPDHAGTGADDGQPSIPSSEAARAKDGGVNSAAIGQEEARGHSEQAVTISDADVPAFLRKDRKPLRPNCLKPDLCAGSGRDHCHACKKAMAARAGGGANIVMQHSNIAGAQA